MFSLYHRYMQIAIGKEKNLKIALMGHSAGGHLALLYAYKNPTQIDLVISEAGPTYFYKENEDLTGQDDIITDENICAMVGIDYKGENCKEDGTMVEIATAVIFIWMKVFTLLVRIW